MGRQVSYSKIGRRWRRMRGFRLTSLRFSLLRLRVRFFGFLGLFVRCMDELKCSNTSGRSLRYPCERITSSRRVLISKAKPENHDHLPQSSVEKANAFYAEAIADCLEFIKRSSLPVHSVSDRDAKLPTSYHRQKQRDACSMID